LAAAVASFETGIGVHGGSCKHSSPGALFVVIITELLLDAQAGAEFLLALITLQRSIQPPLTLSRRHPRRSPSCSIVSCLD